MLPLASLAREPRRLSLRESYSSLRVVRRGRVGARPPQFFFFSSSVALPASIRKAESSPLSKAVASGLRIKKPDAVPVFRAGVPSHLWLGTGPPGPSLLNSSPIPVRRKLRAWDCKLTPADCACQERNTTGCIPSNDGLDAGLGTGFPQKIQASGVRRQASGVRRLMPMLVKVALQQIFLSSANHNSFAHNRLHLAGGVRTDCGVLRTRAIFSRLEVLRPRLSEKLALMVSICKGSKCSSFTFVLALS